MLYFLPHGKFLNTLYLLDWFEQAEEIHCRALSTGKQLREENTQNLGRKA
jgi:hypothetical protein